MAISLSELLQAQAALREKEEKAAAPQESMSMAQLKELVAGGAQGTTEKKQKSDGAIVKIYQEVKRHTGLLEQLVKISERQSILNTRENAQEQQRLMERVAGALEDIRENTQPKKPEKVKDQSGSPLGILGALGTALAVALGGLVGAIQGYVKGLKVVGSALYKGLIWVSDFFPALKKVLFNMEVTFALGAEMIKDAFKTFSGKVMKVFDAAVDFVKQFFSGEKFAGIAKVFGTVKTTLSNFFAPIVESFKAIESASGPISKAVAFVKNGFDMVLDFFRGIWSKISAFGTVFSATAKIVSKIAMPLTVIMTIWDTVKGAIEGFEKDGIVGAIAGAIKGLINSLIMAPLDMLKSAVSWIAGAFGFDKVEAMLDSFSFEGLFSQFVDAIFSPIETLKKMFNGAVDAIQSIHIPEIGFTIPIIDKKVSIGPFYPFKKEGGSTPSTSPAAPAAPKTEDASKPAPAAAPAAKATSAPGEGTKRAEAPKPAEAAATPPTPAPLPIKEGEPQRVGAIEAPVQSAAAEPKAITGFEFSSKKIGGPELVQPQQPEQEVKPSVMKDFEFSSQKIPMVDVTGSTTPVQQAPAAQPSVSQTIGGALSETTNIWNKAINIGRDGVAIPGVAGIGQAIGGVLSGTTDMWNKAINIGKQPTGEAAAVYNQSAMNAEAARAPAASQNVVVAPQTTNVQNNQTSIMRIPSRNSDTSVRSYLESRYAY